MKPTLLFLFLFIASSSVKSFAQKAVTPDIASLNLHFSNYKDLDAQIKNLEKVGYTKIDWIDWQGKPTKNPTYKLVQDTLETIQEIVHGENKLVLRVNVYYGYTPKKWASLSARQKMNISTNLFLIVRNLINKEFDENQQGQRKLSDPYKISDYEVPETFLKAMDERKMGYFAYWGDFNHWPIELESYNSRYIKLTLTDPKVSEEYYRTKH